MVSERVHKFVNFEWLWAKGRVASWMVMRGRGGLVLELIDKLIGLERNPLAIVLVEAGNRLTAVA